MRSSATRWEILCWRRVEHEERTETLFEITITIVETTMVEKKIQTDLVSSSIRSGYSVIWSEVIHERQGT